MQNPTVSFVIPCYKLAHLLSECVNSILSQSFTDFEVLIMDDCSPDNTPEVAGSFNDSRVRYIRNNPNLGHLRNYNKGIELSQGKYVWLISADDYLRRPHILQRYVEVLECDLSIGYAFCPAVSVKNNQEGEILSYSIFRDQDCIVAGRSVLKELFRFNIVPAASGMVRRELYTNEGLFPLSMPHVGDWYLWSRFAFHSNVAYFSEPMVCYREHDLSMTTSALSDNANFQFLLAEDIELFWHLKHMADEIGFKNESRMLMRRIAVCFAKRMVQNNQTAMVGLNMSLVQFEDALAVKTVSKKEKSWIRARVYEAIGDLLYWQGDQFSTMNFYLEGLKNDHWMAKSVAKSLLFSFGRYGGFLRKHLTHSSS